MGLKAMLYALHESPYSGKQQLIHIAIAEAVNNETMIGFISQEAIAKAAKCSIETVRLTVKRMVESGHLKIVQEARQHRATVYQIVIPAAQVPPSSKGADQTQPPNPQAPAPKLTGPAPKSPWGHPVYTPVLITRPHHSPLRSMSSGRHTRASRTKAQHAKHGPRPSRPPTLPRSSPEPSATATTPTATPDSPNSRRHGSTPKPGTTTRCQNAAACHLSRPRHPACSLTPP